jgi:hypothetical protein
MTMTAAEIDGVVFAVGSAQLADAAQAPAAIEAMQTAMVNNIGATVTAARHGQRRAKSMPAARHASGRPFSGQRP